MAEFSYEEKQVVIKKMTTTERRVRSTSQAARRRRMEIRRVRFVSGEQNGAVFDERRRKRETGVYCETAKDVVVLCESLSSTVMALPDLKYGVASVCGRRREMEDAYAIHPFFLRQQTAPFHYSAVYDGHGCSLLDNAQLRV